MDFTALVFSAAVLIGLVALGDIISVWTKALIPSMATAMIVYMLLTWVGMPKTLPDVSGFGALGDWALLILCVHLGTIVKPIDYIKNWKMLILAASAVVGGLIMCVGLGGLIFGFDKMLAGAGACCGGGCISGLAAIDKLNELGLTSILVVPTLMICAVDPLGQPICSFFVKKYVLRLNPEEALRREAEAKKNSTEPERLTSDGIPYGSEENPSPWIRSFIPKKYEENGVLLFELAALAYGCQLLADLTGIDATFYAFFLGIIGCATGLLRMNVLDRSHSDGLLMIVMMGAFCATMNDVTPSLFAHNVVIVLSLIVLSAVGLGLGGAIAGKIMHYDLWLSVAAGIAIMFQNPGINVIIDEVSRRYGKNEAEVAYINEKLSAPILISVNLGFTIGLGITVSLLLPTLLPMFA